MLRNDLSDLPAADTDAGVLPDPDPRFVTVLVDELVLEPSKPKAGETLSRHSAAASCLYRVALLRDGVEPEPMDLAGHHVTNLGTLVHEAWQDALRRKHGEDVAFEVPTVIENLTSGSCDAWLTQEDHVLELKTTGGFGYKMMVGERGTAEGPKSSHIVQLALNVMGLDAAKGTLIYLSNEAISKGIAERKGIDEVTRFGAQWTFTRERLQPLADEWLEQLRWVRDHPTEEVPRFVPHEMPKGARLNPITGAWSREVDGEVVDTGKVWGGQYCSYCPVVEECQGRFKTGG